MKIKTGIIAVLMLLLTLSSCTSNTSPIIITDFTENFSYVEANDKPYTYNCIDASVALQYSDGNIFFWGGPVGQWGATVCKLNPSTGIISSVCIDPLCDHNTPDCPFFGLRAWFYVYDNKVFYKRSYTYTYRNKDGSIRSTLDVSDSVYFDIIDSKVNVLQPIIDKNAGEYLRQLYTDNFRYYYDYIFDENFDGYLFKMCCQDINSGDVSVIGGENNKDAVLERFVFILNDRIYFVDGKRLYSRNLDNTDEIVHCTGNFGEIVMTDGQSIYFEVVDGNDKNVFCMTDINDYSSATLIIEDCTDWFLTENYVYYTDGDSRNIGQSEIKGYANSEIILQGNNIFRCDHNGANHELIFSFDNEYRNYQLTNMIVADNYVYGLYHLWNDSDKDGIYRDGDQFISNSSIEDFTIMRIDVTDGSVYFIKAES